MNHRRHYTGFYTKMQKKNGGQHSHTAKSPKSPIPSPLEPEFDPKPEMDHQLKTAPVESYRSDNQKEAQAFAIGQPVVVLNPSFIDPLFGFVTECRGRVNGTNKTIVSCIGRFPNGRYFQREVIMSVSGVYGIEQNTGGRIIPIERIGNEKLPWIISSVINQSPEELFVSWMAHEQFKQYLEVKLPLLREQYTEMTTEELEDSLDSSGFLKGMEEWFQSKK